MYPRYQHCARESTTTCLCKPSSAMGSIIDVYISSASVQTSQWTLDLWHPFPEGYMTDYRFSFGLCYCLCSCFLYRITDTVLFYIAQHITSLDDRKFLDAWLLNCNVWFSMRKLAQNVQWYCPPYLTVL